MDGHLAYQMDFLEACSAGDIDKARLLINSGHVDCNFHHRVNGWTALHWAARRGHENITELLLRNGFDPKATTKEGRTPSEVTHSESVKLILANSQKSSDCGTDEMVKLNDADVVTNRRNSSNGSPKENGERGALPGYIKDSRTPSKTTSFDSALSPPPDSPTTPVKSEVYSYGRRDSLNRTRFLLVRTREKTAANAPAFCSLRSGHGKESFKRVTLPGGGSVDFLKLTIERAMKRGRVVEVVTLPDGIPIETDEQIRNLTDSQKVEVVFEPYDNEQKVNGDRKLSLTEVTRSEVSSNRAPRLQRKAVSMMDELSGDQNVKVMNGDVQGSIPNGNGAHRITLEEETDHTLEDPDAASTDSSLSSAVVSEIEESTSSNCSFSASSSYAKTRTVLPQNQMMKNSIELSAPVDVSMALGEEKKSEDPNVQGDFVIKLESPEDQNKPMGEEVSCNYSFRKNSADNEAVDLSVIQVNDDAAANGGFAAQKISTKASQILGRVSDLEVVEHAEEERRELQRRIFFAVAAGVAVIGVGGAAWYFYSRAK